MLIVNASVQLDHRPHMAIKTLHVPALCRLFGDLGELGFKPSVRRSHAN